MATNKRKKIDAALDNLFSATRKPAPGAPLPDADQPPAPPVEVDAAAVQPAPPQAEPLLAAPPPVHEAQAAPPVSASQPDNGSPQTAPAASSPPAPAQPTPPAARQAGSQNRQVVVFSLGNEFFGVDIANVDSIIKNQAITVVPNAHFYVSGVINLRGTVLPVIDLRKRFGMQGEAAAVAGRRGGDDSRIIVLLIKGEKVGFVVDAVAEVIQAPADSIEPPPPLVTTVNSAYLTGIAKAGERLIMLLDLNQVLGA